MDNSPFLVSQYIEIDSQKRFGKALISGTRITVGDVLLWLAHGMSHQEILEDFPELNESQISACLHYAAIQENILKISGSF